MNSKYSYANYGPLSARHNFLKGHFAFNWSQMKVERWRYKEFQNHSRISCAPPALTLAGIKFLFSVAVYLPRRLVLLLSPIAVGSFLVLYSAHSFSARADTCEKLFSLLELSRAPSFCYTCIFTNICILYNSIVKVNYFLYKFFVLHGMLFT